MNIQDVKDLFQIHLDPIKEDIRELKEDQKKMLNIMPRHDEAIQNLQYEVQSCKDCIHEIKKSNNKKIWDILKIGLAGISGAIISKLF